MSPNKHAALAPSDSARWMICPGAVAICIDLPKKDATAYTSEGTWAHRKAELLLTGETMSAEEESEALAEADKYGFSYEDLDVSVYVDYVKTHASGGELFIEDPLELSSVTGEKGATGTSDAVIIKDNRIHIVDLKYGRGEKVDAENNTQLIIYALAALDKYGFMYDIQGLRMTIVQPRLSHISEFELNMEAAESWRASIREAADRAVACIGKPEKWTFQPSAKGCRWCPIRGNCLALTQHCLSVAGVKMLGTRAAAKLSGEDVGAVLSQLPLIRQWADALEDYALDSMIGGSKIPGWKLVAGRAGARKWLSDAEADNALKDAKLKADLRYTRKLISPAQAESLLKSGKIAPESWAELQKMITQDTPKPVIAPESDKRREWADSLADAFPDESKSAK